MSSDKPEDADSFLSPAEWTDVVLKVESKQLHFSKAYLAAWSPVFRCMFYGDFKENSKDVIELPDKSANDIQELLRCICPCPTVKPVKKKNVFTLLLLADEYQIQDLLKRCSEVLKECIKQSYDNESLSAPSATTSTDTLSALEALKLSCDVGLSDLTEFLLPYCAQQPLSEIEKYHEKLPLSVITVLYHAMLKILTQQVNAKGAITFAVVCYNSGSYTCSLCGKSGSGPHSSCSVCSRTICTQQHCAKQHLACISEPTKKVVYCNDCKIYTLLGSENSKCKCFKLAWSKTLPKTKKQAPSRKV